MTGEQLRKLSKMKKLINSNKKRFMIRRDRDYISELLVIGINEEMAWREILSLSGKDYINDYKPFYAKDGECLTFKKVINGYKVYIKIKIEEYNESEQVLCLSFHIDYR